MTKQTIKSTGCCEPFDPKPWEDKEIHWQDKLYAQNALRHTARIT